MNLEQLEAQVLQNGRTIAGLSESLKSAHKRIDDNDALTSQIHKLASSIETLAYQVKVQGERMEETASGQQAQGVRIGALEHKPALRWEALVERLIGLGVAAVFGVMAAKIMI